MIGSGFNIGEGLAARIRALPKLDEKTKYTNCAGVALYLIGLLPKPVRIDNSNLDFKSVLKRLNRVNLLDVRAGDLAVYLTSNNFKSWEHMGVVIDKEPILVYSQIEAGPERLILSSDNVAKYYQKVLNCPPLLTQYFRVKNT